MDKSLTQPLSQVSSGEQSIDQDAPLFSALWVQVRLMGVKAKDVIKTKTFCAQPHNTQQPGVRLRWLSVMMGSPLTHLLKVEQFFPPPQIFVPQALCLKLSVGRVKYCKHLLRPAYQSLTKTDQ